MIFSYKKLLYVLFTGIGLSTYMIMPMSSRVLRRGSVLAARAAKSSFVSRFLPAPARLRVLGNGAARRTALMQSRIRPAVLDLSQNNISKSKTVIEPTKPGTAIVPSRTTERDAKALKRWLELQAMRQNQALMARGILAPIVNALTRVFKSQGVQTFAASYAQQLRRAVLQAQTQGYAVVLIEKSLIDSFFVNQKKAAAIGLIEQPLAIQALAATGVSLVAARTAIAAPEAVTVPGIAGKFIPVAYKSNVPNVALELVQKSGNHNGFERSRIVLEPQSLALTPPEAQKASWEAPEHVQREKVSDASAGQEAQQAHTISPENSDAHKKAETVLTQSFQDNQKNNSSDNNDHMPPKTSLARNIGGASLSNDGDDVVIQDNNDMRSLLIPEIEPMVPVPDTPEEDLPVVEQPTHSARLPLVQPSLPVSDEEQAITLYGNLILQALAARTDLHLEWAGNSSKFRAMFIAYNNQLADYRKKNNRDTYQLYLGANERMYRVINIEWQRIIKAAIIKKKAEL